MRSEQGEAILRRLRDTSAAYYAKYSELETLSSEVQRRSQIGSLVDPLLLEREARVRLELAAARRSACGV